jgi:uncharacterized repeat protein (TIGR01451 family)
MKKFFLLAFAYVLLHATTNAQWVSIPDTVFANRLYVTGFWQCLQGDNVNGWQLDTVCAGTATGNTISVAGLDVYDIRGVEYFDNVRKLYADHCRIDSIHALPPLLQELYVDYQQGELDSLLPQLRYLCALPSTLKQLACEGNALTSIPLLPSGLIRLSCYKNNISTLPPIPSGIKELGIGYNPLTVIPPLPSGLTFYHCRDLGITALSPLPSTLRFLNCGENPLTSLPTLPDTLDALYIDYTNITCLEPLKVINTFFYLNAAFTCLPNYPLLNQSSYPALNTLPVCDAFNSAGCSFYANINGKVYNDTNGNCQYDSLEPVRNGLTVKLWENGSLIKQTITAYGGTYYFDTDHFGTYQVTVDTANVAMRIVCPGAGFLTSMINAADSTDYNLNFALECRPGFDMEARSVSSVSVLRPANITKMDVVAGAVGGLLFDDCVSGVSGNVTLTLSGPVQYVSPAVGALMPTVNGNTLMWSIADYANVSPTTDFDIIVRTDTTAQLGQQVCFTLTVNPIANDNNITNNLLTQCFTIVNSYDPNDKQVYPPGKIDTAQKELVYTIRFQNTGNADAQHIYITDTLSSSIDASSFQLLAYSHLPGVHIDGNKVRFNFPYINLPDSTTNEPSSHGFVQFKVRLKDNLAVGTGINNTAYIYFDFNAPVVTNTTINTIYTHKPESIGKYRIQRGVRPSGKCIGCNQ